MRSAGDLNLTETRLARFSTMTAEFFVRRISSCDVSTRREALSKSLPTYPAIVVTLRLI
jgi:hypothetical protein